MNLILDVRENQRGFDWLEKIRDGSQCKKDVTRGIRTAKKNLANNWGVFGEGGVGRERISEQRKHTFFTDNHL